MKTHHVIRTDALAEDTFSAFLYYLQEYPLLTSVRLLPHQYTCQSIQFNPEEDESLSAELGTLYPEYQLRVWAKKPEDLCSIFRAEYAIPQTEGIILLSDEEYGNERWVYGSFFETVPHYFLHTDMWTAFDNKEDAYPLGFQIAAVYLASAIQNPGRIFCL